MQVKLKTAKVTTEGSVPDSPIPAGVPSKIIEPTIEDYIRTQHQVYLDAIADRVNWEQRQLRWIKLRYGIRGTKTFPWPGASNMHLPLPDKTIKKRKPEYIAIGYNALPMVTFEPMGGEDALQEADTALKASYMYDWILRTRMKVFAPLNILVDIQMERGFSILKIIPEFKYEPIMNECRKEDIDPALFDPAKVEDFIAFMADKYEFDVEDQDDRSKIEDILSKFLAGNDIVQFTVIVETKNAPAWIPLPPEAIVVPTGSETIFDLEDCSTIDHPVDYTAWEMYEKGRDGTWDKDVVDGLLEQRGYNPDNPNEILDSKAENRKEMGTNDIQLQLSFREGTQDKIVGKFRVHEQCVWFDADRDGTPERHILEYCEDDMTQPLRFIHYFINVPHWPYYKFPQELLTSRHFGPRGIIEAIEPLAKSLNMNHNAANNRLVLETAMMFWYVPGKVNQGNVRFVPGQGVPVKEPGSIGVLNTITGASDLYTRQEQYMKAWAEEYMASPDIGMASAINPTGTSKARSAAEISRIGASQAPVLALDIAIFQHALQGAFWFTWAVWQQFGPVEKIAFRMAQQPILMSKDEVRNQYNMVPNGRLGTSDPVIEAQKAARRFDVLSGNVSIDQYGLLTDMLEKDDPRLLKKLLLPKQVAGGNIIAKDQIEQMRGGAPTEGSAPAPQQITGAQNAGGAPLAQ